MFFLFLRIPRKTYPQRYLLTQNGTAVPVAPPSFQARRRGKFKSSGPPIDKVAFQLAKDWTREDDADGKACTLHGPEDASGQSAAIHIQVIVGADDARKLHADLLQQRQSLEKFNLVQGGVVPKERGMQAAELRYTCISEGVQLAVREMVQTVGFRLLAYVQAQCPAEILRDNLAAMNAIVDSIKPSRRLEMPGVLREGLNRGET
jgi:hypothetical protein